MMLTYRFDTTNPFSWGSPDWHQKQNEIDNNVRKLFIYFLYKSKKIVLKYWPSDFNLPTEHQISTQGVKTLQPFALEIREIPRFEMEALICELNDGTRNTIIDEMNRTDDRTLPWFYMELLDEKGMIRLLIADHGEDVLMNLSNQDLLELQNKEHINLSLLHCVEKTSINL